MTAHYVYRIYDEGERLIYVGCTQNLFGRLRAHKQNSWWSFQAAHVTARVYPNKWTAREIERTTIREENPRWNIRSRSSRASWAPGDYVDYVTASLNQSAPLTPIRIKDLHLCANHFRFRFGRKFPLELPVIPKEFAS